MQKTRSIYVERVEKFHTTKSWTDVNIRSCLYGDTQAPEILEVFSVPGLERMSLREATKKGKFTPCKLGDKFGPSWSTHFFRCKFVVPKAWKGEVHFLWDANCEACIYIDGEPIQGFLGGNGDDRRAEFILTKHVKGGEVFDFFVELAANGMFGNGAAGLINHVDANRYFSLDKCEIAIFNRDAWDLLWDFNVIADMAKFLPEQDPRSSQALYAANAIQNCVWTDDPSTIAKGREIAAGFLKETNGPQYFSLSAIGHSHIDTAWLWPYAETRRKVVRSWATQLRLIEEYPWYKFGASQAQQYEWLKQDQPKLYNRLKDAVGKGSFVPIGGTWVEMDCNLPSGESFCRQFLYGQRYFKSEFGSYCSEFWLPDTFGYSAQLPQIIKASGIDYFLTQKLSWNNINKFPHHTFIWEGLDGSEVLTHFPPADTYTSYANVKDVTYSVTNFKDKERSDKAMLVFGMGDGGGGPQMEMLERIQRMKNLKGLPKVQAETPTQFFKKIERDSQDKPLLKWKGELYFELHRGTYTSQAKTKKGNRKSEFLLREVELWSIAAQKDLSYPKQELDRLWKLTLLNQFHDVLPGSSITEVFVDAEKYYAEIESCGTQLLHQALDSYVRSGSQKRSNKIPRALFFNSLGWKRQETILREGKLYRVDCFPFSYAFADTLETTGKTQPLGRVKGKKELIMTNDKLSVSVCKATGRILSLVHLGSKRECFDGPANAFVMFDDVNLFWDAWDAEIFHLEKRREITEVLSMEFERNDSSYCCIKSVLKVSERSTITQRIVLAEHSERLDFQTQVTWNENRKFLKVEFATAIKSPYSVATYETQFGHLQRPTHKNTSWDAAKFEVCAHKWMDLSEYGFGVALLNDCKYGHAAESNVMRLSLLRSPKAPDAFCDIGDHEFTYSIMPHTGSFQEAGVIREAYSLNCPLVMHEKLLPETPCPRPLFDVSESAIILETVKKAEDDDNLILRLYESFGSTVETTVVCSIPFKSVKRVNILEHETKEGVTLVKEGCIALKFTPFQVITIKIRL